MPPLIYDKFVKRVAHSFAGALTNIEAEHNFELGSEFEIAICKTLRRILPQRFGICRGYLVNVAGEVAGDDVIIYEQLRYPTIRIDREDEGYATKKKIPIDAAFAYIEAKHSLHIDGESDASLRKAVSQAAAAKRLCQQRDPVLLTRIAHGVNLSANLSARPSPGWPDTRNPFYTAVFARHVRLNQGGPIIESSREIEHALVDQSFTPDLLPDFIVAGASNVALPVLPLGSGERTITSPFYVPGQTELTCRVAEDIAFGVAVVHLFWALDYIELGPMPWSRILGDSLGVPTR